MLLAKTTSVMFDIQNDAYCWGYNNYGALGDGTNIASYGNPIQFTEISEGIEIATGDDTTCVLTTSSNVYCVGSTDDRVNYNCDSSKQNEYCKLNDKLASLTNLQLVSKLGLK